MKQKIFSTAKKIATNRYTIVVVLFLLWIVVIDDRNLLDRSLFLSGF